MTSVESQAPTLARLSFWVPTARMEDFHEAYDRLLMPLLKERGLGAVVPLDRPAVDGVCSRLFEVETPAAVATRARALRQFHALISLRCGAP